jgi:hypothetical protein
MMGLMNQRRRAPHLHPRAICDKAVHTAAHTAEEGEECIFLRRQDAAGEDPAAFRAHGCDGVAWWTSRATYFVVRFMSAAPCTGAWLFFANSTVPPPGVLPKCVRLRT